MPEDYSESPLNEPTFNPGQLSQEEIDSLLSAADEGKETAVLWNNGERGTLTERVRPEPYDFRTPIFLSELEMRRMRLLHEDFIRFLEARLSMFLRADIGIKMSKLATLPYRQYTESMSHPTHICLFKVNPLPGICILDVTPRLALTLAGKMLGGSGKAVNTDRYLTEIETDLIDELVGLLLGEWCTQWEYDETLEPVIIGHELSGRFLQTAPHDSIVIVLALEVELRDCLEQMQIGFPLHMMEPLIRFLQEKRRREMDYSHGERKLEWREAYGSIEIPVTASWDTPERTVSEWLKLKKGDVIPLPSASQGLRDVKLLLSGIELFIGEPGVNDGKWSARIKSKISQQR